MFEPNRRLTPPRYPVIYEALMALKANTWVHTEVSMLDDVKAWLELPAHDQKAISTLLQGFTKLESYIGCYWREVVARLFRTDEIVGLATECAAQEVTHAYAYQYLEDSLGLDTTDAFELNYAAKRKLKLYSDPDSYGLAESLAFMSGAGEGISLFSSFLLLLAYPAKGHNLLGLKTILSWSVRDESLHSDFACYLYKMLKQPVDELWLKEAMLEAINAELAFVKPIFDKPLCTGLTYEQVEAFIYYRANDRLAKLGSGVRFGVDKQALAEPKQLFELQIASTPLTDFFVMGKGGGSYVTALSTNLLEVNFEAL